MRKIYFIILLSLSVKAGFAQCAFIINTQIVQDITCNGGNNGKIVASATGGVGPYTYEWKANGFAFSSNDTIDTLIALTYVVKVTDQGAACIDSVSVDLTEPMGVGVVDNGVDSAYCGMSNGHICVYGAGGTPPYTYSLMNGGFQTYPCFTGLAAGAYTVTAIDIQGCIGNNVFVVGGGLGPSVDFQTTIIPSACGQNNGSIIVDTIIGMNPPYTYSYYGPGLYSPDGEIVIDSIPSGTYVLFIQDNIACYIQKSIIVNDSTFTVQLNPTMPNCNLCDGSINSSIVGGTAPYNYIWSNSSQTNNLSNLCTGNYFLEVTDSAGCYAAASISLAPLNAPVIQIDNIINASCSASGSAAISVTGGVGAISYLWMPGGNTTPNPNLQAGSYTVTATDANGCSSTQSVYIGNNTNVYIYATQIGQPNCANNGFIEVATAGGTSPYNYAWSNGAIGDSIGGLANGIYEVTVTDANGCSGNGQFYMQINCYNIISGVVYNDANQNCVQDVGELGIVNKVLYTSDGYYGSTDLNGNYNIQTAETNPTVSVSSYYVPYYTPNCPVTGAQQVNFATSGDTINNVNFGFYANPNYFDLSIHPGWTAGHPGFAKSYWIYYQNQSSTSQNANIRFVYDEVLIFDSVSMGGVHNPTLHTIEWTHNNFSTAGYGTERAYFTVPVSVAITDSLHSYFEITPIIGDAYSPNNVLDVIEPVTGSRDPNDKSVIPKGEGPTGNILQTDSTLLYTVRFQNNGNDTAYTVVVVDTLSPYLDPSTIVPGASKHPYTFTLSGQGVMTWRFDHIMLPDSLTNEEESKGFFNYTVNQRQNNPLGTVIENTAYIYFDFNDAIITNTTINTLVAPVALNESKISANNFIVYPNPAGSEVMIQFETKEICDVKLELYNMMGEVVKTKSIKNTKKGNNLESLNLIDVASGIYFVKVKTATTQSVQKLVIEK